MNCIIIPSHGLIKNPGLEQGRRIYLNVREAFQQRLKVSFDTFTLTLHDHAADLSIEAPN